MIFKLLWPEICPFCGKLYAKGVCPACEKKVSKLVVVQPACMKCGKPIRSAEQEYCYDCENTRHYYDRGSAVWLHKFPVNYSIYQFKYHNQRMFGKYFAKAMYKKHRTLILNWEPDVIIPIPLHFYRKMKRGYNQAQIIAEELGRITGIFVDTKILKRKKYTNPQKKLGHHSRRKNLNNAFIVKKSRYMYKKVILIDDIYTTGNTIDEAAKKLKEAGVENVFFLTLSIGQGY